MENSAVKELKNRFAELAARSYRDNVFCFTNFLSAGDAAYAYDVVRENGFSDPRGVSAWGGAEDCERIVLRFGNAEEMGYETPFPISILKAAPVNERFADELTHRDFLGALMNLGIERDMIGDIAVREHHAYIFVIERIAPYIIENLRRVKHTDIDCVIVTEPPEDIRPVLKEETVVVSGIRIDSIIAKLYRLSRSTAQELIASGKLLVNGRLKESAGFVPKEGDVIALRGYGKFVYRGESRETKKGRLAVKVEKYS